MHPQTQQNATNVTTLFLCGGEFCRWAEVEIVSEHKYEGTIF